MRKLFVWFVLLMCCLIGVVKAESFDEKLVQEIVSRDWYFQTLDKMKISYTQKNLKKLNIPMVTPTIEGAIYQTKSQPAEIGLTAIKESGVIFQAFMNFDASAANFSRVVDCLCQANGEYVNVQSESGKQCLIWENDGFTYEVSSDMVPEQAPTIDDIRKGKGSFSVYITGPVKLPVVQNTVTQSEEANPVQVYNLKIGESFEVDEVVAKVNNFSIKKELRFSAAETGSVPDSLKKTMEDGVYLTLVCDITNKNKKALNLDAFVGNVKINEHEYELGNFSTVFSIAPLDHKKVYLYGLVPSVAVKKGEPIVFTFSFDKQCAWENIIDPSVSYDHQYTIEVKVP